MVTGSASDQDLLSSTSIAASTNEVGESSTAIREVKELQYIQEFLTEITERMGQLDHFVRSTFVCEINTLHGQIESLESDVSTLTQSNAQLQTEMADLREFYAQNTSFGDGSSSFPTSTSDTKRENQPECDDNSATRDSTRMAKLFPTLSAMNAPAASSDADLIQQLNEQCDEMARLLEMAKQEIQLCHHENDVQKSRLAEFSSALFKDQELAALRNQLLSEKKRVKNLESENVALRGSQLDQSMKIQSLLMNSVPSGNSSAAPSGYPQVAGNQSLEQDDSALVAQIRNMQRRGSAALGITTASSLAPFGPRMSTQAVSNPVTPGSIDSKERQEKQSPTSASSSPKRGNQSSDSMLAGGMGSTKSSWLHHMLGFSTNSMDATSRKRPPAGPSDLGAESNAFSLSRKKQFLSSLLVSETQRAAATMQSKVRRQGNVPTVLPPRATIVPDDQRARSAAKKKTRPSSAAGTAGKPQDPREDLHDMIIVCRQIVWSLYKRFLMAEEAMTLLAPRAQGLAMAHNSSKVSLTSVVFHFFLERTPSDDDAVRDAIQFIDCMHQVQDEAGDLRIFCEFLDGTRPRDQLCFYLWVLQVTEDTKIGIAYDAPLTVNGSSNNTNDAESASLPHICTLKATFLTRTIFRLFHFKALKCCQNASTSRKSAHSARASLVTVAMTTSSTSSRKDASVSPSSSPRRKDMSVSPSTSPRRRRKSRLSIEHEVTSALVSAPSGTRLLPPSQLKSLLDHAIICFRDAVVLNNGLPLTIEAFNSVLMQFAVAPAAEELSARLGPFFQPSGEEKKLSIDVFLVLTLEMYACQLDWRKKQLQSLFIILAKQCEAEELLRLQKFQEAAELAAATKGNRGTAKMDTKRKSTKSVRVKKHPTKKKKNRDEHNTNNKYLKGLTRKLLRQFLVQSGIVADILHVDIDALFVQLLEMTHQTAATIHFDELYDILAQLDWLGNRDFQVDATTSILNQQWNATGDDAKRTMIANLRDVWSTQARQSLVLCENDPNVFVRRHAKVLSSSIDHYLMAWPSANNMPHHSSSSSSQHFWHSLQSIRDFLSFAWRTIAKRTGEFQIQRRAPTATSAAPHWLLSEFYFVNRALCVISDFPGYGHGVAQDSILERISGVGDTPYPVSAASPAHGDCWWDLRRMELDDLWLSCTIGVSRSSNSLSPSKENQNGNQQHHRDELDSMMRELQHILLRFSFHISHLFATYANPRFLASGMSMQDWLLLARELRRTAGANFPDLSKAQEFFYQVYPLPQSREEDVSTQAERGQLHDVWISKSQFVALLVRIAFTTYQARVDAKQQQRDPLVVRAPRISARLRPPQIVAQFCHDVIVPTASQPRPRAQEVDFAHKLSCPLVCRVLLEHRSFLRLIFFFYAKQDDDNDDEKEGEGRDANTKQREPDGGAEDGASTRTTLTLHNPDIHGFQLRKTKRSSMNFDEFRAFLADMELLVSSNNGSKFAASDRSPAPLNLESAQVVFCSVMSPENSDTSQMEFEEFAAAIAALAVYRDPNPFCLWHSKIDRFVLELQRVVQRKELRFD
uniref:Uncharacterized protein n=1 Tax=Globisporangium ultimum (strain ATCC 200006 / CBS 805.95 / DAOM BR144) TaxID=431595 RepID=K3X2J8_GLOUD